MKRFKTLKTFSLVIAVSLAMTACDNGDVEPELTTTSSIVGQTTAPDPDPTTTVGGGETTSTTLVGQTVDSYDVVLRESTDDGETLYIVVPPGDYTAIDLENFIGDLMEGDDDLQSVEVFDDAAALDSFLKDESEQTAGDLAAIDAHHLVSLVDARTIRFQGPFADEGEYAIGS
ncbi:MAG: hypothetical protein ACFCU2_02975 [Acidimicrobiia bacterium]